MRITLLMMILAIPPLIEVTSRSNRPADANSRVSRPAAAGACLSTLWMVPLVEAILIAGFALSRRERQRLDAHPESAPVRDGRRPRRVAWISLIS